MKKHIVLFILLLNSGLFAQNSSLKVSYLVTAKMSNHKQAYKEPFLLLISNEKSVFINQNEIIRDSLFSKLIKKSGNTRTFSIDMRSAGMQKAMQYKINISWVVEKKLIKQQLTLQQKALMSTIQYTQRLPQLHWKLKDSTKIVLGYAVKKATLNYKGRNYTAWYAPMVPVPDGPYKFWGLPGLIFEIYDAKKEYTFVITGIEQRKGISFPKDYLSKNNPLVPLIKTTEKSFRRDFEKTFNASNVMGNTVVIGQDEEEYVKERVEKMKALHDNPIELNER